MKIVSDLTADHGGYRAVPKWMKMPLFESVQFSAEGWFTLIFLRYTVCTVALLATPLRRPLLLVPDDWSGKGMWVYLIFLWAITLGNLIKALPGFSEQRLGAEANFFVYALIATFLLLARGRGHQLSPPALSAQSDICRRPLLLRFLVTCLPAMIVAGLAYTTSAGTSITATLSAANPP